jgi:hypothetical protein
MLELYTTYALLMVVEVQKSIPAFWSRFFPTSYFSNTDEIAIDKVSKNYLKLAPFVAPNVQGRVSKKDGNYTVSFRPAYLKPKDTVDPNTDLVRQPGEDFGSGSFSLEQRANLLIGELLEGQRIKIDNRIEWMRAQAVITGKVVVAGEDYPSVTVDFRRHASLTYTLAGAAKWDVGTATPTADIMAARRNIKDRSGSVVRDVIFGATAYDNFYLLEIKDKEAKLMNNTIRGSETDVSFLRDGFEGVEYMGRYIGSNGAGFNIWVYTQKYENDAGTLVDIMPQTAVVLASIDGLKGVDAFGRIKDLEANLRAVKYFPKMWDEKDPSLRYIMTQCAPLPIPGQPDASAVIYTS